MSRTDNQNKGDLLEDAVESIQRAIVSSNPSLSKAKLTIERKKLIFPGNVKKEIDVYVEVDPGYGMNSVFIFECKNWEKPIPANEIVIFNEKIDDTNATKGFFVAKKFSQNAVNEAKKHSRVVLLNAAEINVDLDLISRFHMVWQKNEKHVDFTMFEKNDDNKQPSLIKVDLDKLISLDGQEITVLELMKKLSQLTIDDKLSQEPTNTFEPGEYSYKHTLEFNYPEENLQFDSRVIEKIEVKAEFGIEIIEPVVVASFAIEEKGEFIKLRFPNKHAECEISLARLIGQLG